MSSGKTDTISTMLREHGYKVTAPRLAVFEVLRNASTPLSSSEIVRLVKNVDKATVYRVISTFEQIGAVRRVWSGFKSKVELGEDFVPHHHHAHCRKCGSYISIRSPKLEHELEMTARDLNFTLEAHHFELSGVCSACR